MLCQLSYSHRVALIIPKIHLRAADSGCQVIDWPALGIDSAARKRAKVVLAGMHGPQAKSENLRSAGRSPLLSPDSHVLEAHRAQAAGVKQVLGVENQRTF